MQLKVQRMKRWTSAMWVVPALLVAAAGCNQGNEGGNNGVEPAPASTTDPNQPARAYVRAVHTVRGAGPITVAIDGETAITGLQFGQASDFIGVHGEKVKIHSSGQHEIRVSDADGKVLTEPLSLDLERGEDFTVVVGGTQNDITLTHFEHTNRAADMDNAKVAVLHADPTLPEIAIAVDGENWTGDIGHGEVTGYRVVEPGSHTLTVMYDKTLVGVVDVDRAAGPSPPPVAVQAENMVTLTQQLDVAAGSVYSVILHSDAGGRPVLYFLEDKFVPELIRAPDVGTPTNPDGATNNATTTGTTNSATGTGNAATGSNTVTGGAANNSTDNATTY